MFLAYNVFTLSFVLVPKSYNILLYIRRGWNGTHSDRQNNEVLLFISVVYKLSFCFPVCQERIEK